MRAEAAAQSKPAATPVQEPVMPAVIEEPIVLAAPVEAPATTPAPLTAVDPRFATPLAGALTLAAMGIPQIPVKRGEKKAFLDGWQNLATTDASQIEAWAKQYNCNFGSVAKAEIGAVWFFELDLKSEVQRIKDETGNDLPETMLVRSRPGRGHFYFRQNAASIAMGNITQPQVKNASFSVRVKNEYVVTPGSVHKETGKPYELFRDVPIIEAPEWFLNWIQEQRVPMEQVTGERDENSLIPHGKIHGYLVREAGFLRNRGFSLESLENALVDWAHDNCAPPLDEEKIRQVARSTKNWKQGDPRPDLLFGGELTQKAGAVQTTGIQQVQEPEIVDRAEIKNVDTPIPPFPKHVMRGFYKDVADVICKNNSIPPQFVRLGVKIILGLRAKGIVFSKSVKVATGYGLMIASSGASKGALWERLFLTLLGDDAMRDVIQILDVPGSGEGLEDAFFDHNDLGMPKPRDILFYCDELMELAQQVRADRQPKLMATLLKLAEKTVVTRTKARGRERKQVTQTCTTARLAVLMCAQSKYIQNAFVGTKSTVLGFYNRIEPEYGELDDVLGGLENIPLDDMLRLRAKLETLPLTGVATVSPEAEAVFNKYWLGKPKEYRVSHVRALRDIYKDAYLSAIAQGRLEASAQDMQDAIDLLGERQDVIRARFFTEDIGDKVGLYISRIKHILFQMDGLIAEGKLPEEVGLTKREFAQRTNAYADSEVHHFNQAWNSVSQMFMDSRPIKARNGKLMTVFYPKATD
ncbi:MAG: bifunctional DNA primase/polymerase [Candidatus Acidiferrales bacterium]